MDLTKSYFECKRCFYKTNIKSNMNKHLDIKILCERTLESFKYQNEVLRPLSLIRIYPTKNNDKSIYCSNCNKNFLYKKSLKNHNKKTCFNSLSKTNSKNVSIVINNFNDIWNTDHINDNDKLLLLFNKSQFSKTLQNILENEVNLNVIIDKTNETGIVYNNNTLQKMSVKEIIKKTMDKLFEQLKIFKNDLINSQLNIEEKNLENAVNITSKKLFDYHKNDYIKEIVNKLISQIYSVKNNNTAELCYFSSSDTSNEEGF